MESALDRVACVSGSNVLYFFHKVTSYEYFVYLTDSDLYLLCRVNELLQYY
jgi:hypothetical protein